MCFKILAACGQTIYSLWLCPPSEISNKLRKLIAKLSKNYEDSIAFEPHITLLPLIYDPTAMIVHKLKELCSKIRPFKVKLKCVDYGDSYYQCVYILVELTSELITANSICRRLFERFDEKPYLPHLSLLYYDPNKINKKQIQQQIDSECKEQSIILEEIEFTVDSVELWITAPDRNKISEWDMYQRIYFNNSSSAPDQKSSAMDNDNNNNTNISIEDPDYFAKDWGKKAENESDDKKQKKVALSNNGTL